MNPLISFNQVLEDGIVLDIPRNTCSQGHNLEIQLETEGAREKEIHMNVTAKVIHLESASGPHLTVFLKFVQFHKEDWEKILAEFDSHQDAVENLFKNMKSG